MLLNQYYHLAIHNLLRHKLRAALAGLGVVISIASVIIVISSAQGVKGFIVDQFNTFGSSLIQVEPKLPESTTVESQQAQAFGNVVTTLTLEDMKAMRRLPNIKDNYAGQIGQALAQAMGTRKTINIFGASPEVAKIDTAAKLATGRFYTETEDNSQARVAVLGSEVAQDLFGTDDIVGRRLSIKGLDFQVIGVFAPRGAAMFFNFDTFVYIPIRTLQKQILGINYISFITNQYADESKVPTTVANIEDLLRTRHKISDNTGVKDDFVITTQAEVMDTLDIIIGGFTLLLIALAAISLIVGGVGIMNIMYVSILERTFEIGLRKAVGATRENILRQFLMEAVIICSLGGVVGIMSGGLVAFLISKAASAFGYAWPFTLPLYSILLSAGFAVACGLIFGLYPARQAANLDPIEALRRE